MPRGKNRSEYIFILDACSSPDFLRNTLDQIFVFKSLSDAQNDNAKVILMNYPSPDGCQFTVLNSDSVVSFTNDVIFKDFGEFLKKLPARPPAKSNWTSVIQHAVSSFAAMHGDTYIQTFFLVLVGDFKTVNEDLEGYVAQITELDITVVAVIEEDVTYSYKPILSRKHMLQAMDNVQIPTHLDSPGLQLMYKFAKGANGILTGPGDFLNFMTFLMIPPPKQEWRQKLQIGSYEFHTTTRKIAEKPSSMVLRKITKGEFEYMPPSKLDNAGDVDMSAAQERVDFDKMVDAQVFHGHPVVIPNDVKQAMVAGNVTSFKILGLVDAEQLPEIYYGGESILAVCADEKSQRSMHFLVFVRKLLEAGKYAIAMRIYKARTTARLFVLIPQPKGWLLMTDLAEGARRFVHPELPEMRDEGQPDAGVSSPGMAALRQHLLDRAPSALFQPRAHAGVHRLAVVDAVRRTFGYNTDCYVPTQSFDFSASISDEMKATLDGIFRSQASDSPPENEEPVEDDEEEDDW